MKELGLLLFQIALAFILIESSWVLAENSFFKYDWSQITGLTIINGCRFRFCEADKLKKLIRVLGFERIGAFLLFQIALAFLPIENNWVWGKNCSLNMISYKLPV